MRGARTTVVVFLAVLAIAAVRLWLMVRTADPPMATGTSVAFVLLLALLLAGSVAVALYGV